MIAAQKAVVRADALKRRKQARSAEKEAKAQAHLADFLQQYAGRVLAGYVPISSEISPLLVMRNWAAPVCVPVVQAREKPLKFAQWAHDCAMEKAPFGTFVPKKQREIVPEVLIVPLVAFTRACYRLGYGGGFYDRTLAALMQTRPIVAVGFAFSAQEVKTLPLEPTDIRLDAIISEQGSIIAGSR